MKTKTERKIKREKRVRSKLWGTSQKPRLSVHKSNRYIYAQAINDAEGVTLGSARNIDAAIVGEKIAKDLIAKKIKSVVFDKGSYKYHGQVKTLADAARKGGLNF